MGNYLRMVIVLSVITLFSGLALGGLNELTYERAQNNILKFKKIPAVADIYGIVAGGYASDSDRAKIEEGLLAEKMFLDVGEKEPVLFFVVKKEGEPYAVALENFGTGFGGDLGVMAGFTLESGELVGIGITTLSETPGLGTRVKDDVFTGQFPGMPGPVYKVKKDGGAIDAVSGATISSRAVAEAITRAKEFFEAHQEEIRQAVSK